MLDTIMGKKIWVVIATAFLLTACANTQDSALDSTGPVSGETSTTGSAPTGDVDSSDMMGQTAIPGSQADLDQTAGSLVYFGFDRFDLTSEARSALQAQAKWLQANSGVSVTVEGHCDERGTREYNLALGDRRATAVKNYLVALGVNPSRVKTISYGKERPAVLGQSESAWSQNRRGYTRVE